MRELPGFGEFDLVWCLDDAVNYLLSGEELEQALRGMRRNLGPGGLLIFDVNTPDTYRTFFAEEVELELNGRRLVWEGRSGLTTSAPGAIAEASFEVEPVEARERAADRRPRCTASATSRKPRCWRRWSAAGLECLEASSATAKTRAAAAASTTRPQQGRLHRPPERTT